MTNLKPILVIATMFLAVVMLWQVASITGFLTNETIPANVTIGNVEPTVGTITCSSGVSDNLVTPLPCQNQTVNCWALVTDENGANDITSVQGGLGTKVIGAGYCNPASNNPAKCVFNSNCTSYTVVNATTRNYTCTFNDFRYFGEVNDVHLNNWSARWTIADSESSIFDVTEFLVYVENLTAIDVQETFLNFGSMALGETTLNDSEVNSTIANCGNWRMDVNVSGTDLPCNTQGTISVGQLKYNGTFGTEYASDTALSTSSVKIPQFASGNLYVDFASNDAGESDQISWQISIPTTGVKGLCTGNVTFYAIRY